MPPRRPPVPSITIPSAVGSTSPPSARRAVADGRDPVGLLAPQLVRVADRRRPLGEAGGEGDQRQLVDRQRDLGAADLGAAQRPRRDAQVADRLAALLALRGRPRSSAPIRSRIASRPVRVGLRPTSWSRTSLPGTSVAATMKKAAEEKSAGTTIRPASSALGRLRRRRASPSRRDVGAGGGQHALGVVAGRQRLDHPRLALGQQPGEEQAGLDLGAGDRQLVGRCRAAARRATSSGGRRSSRALELGAHPAQRLGDPVDRAAADRVVAVERPLAALLPGEPARQQPQQGAGVADVDRRRSRRRAGRRPGSAARRPAPRASLDPGAPSACDRGQRRARVGGVEVALDRRSPPRPSPRSAPRGGRSTCPAGGAQRAAQGPAGSKRRHRRDPTAPAPSTVTRVAELADQRRGALGLLVAGDPERDRARGHVRGRVQRHVLDVDAGLAQRQRQLGDRPRPVGDDDPQLAQRARRRLGFEQPAAVLAGGGVPGGDRLAVAARGSAPPPRRGAAPPPRPSRRPPRGCWRRCRPRSPGWSRRRGSCRGSSARPRAAARESRLSAAAASATSALATHVRQVADRRHQPVVGGGVDRLRAGAERRRRAAAGGRRGGRWSARSGSGTSGRPRRGRRGRSRPRPSRRPPAGGRR